MNKLIHESIELLKKLVSTPSLSGEESQTARHLEGFFLEKKISFQRKSNNLIARNKYFDPQKKTIVLNSHHDTVKPNKSWSYEPFKTTLQGDKLIGLGSNDAGASLVSLIATFVYFYEKKNPVNLILVASAEEENFGPKGIKSVLPELEAEIDLAIVGEPTEMQLAIAEKGLLVIDGLAKGEAGHAARPNGKNAIDVAMKDILWIHGFQFPKISPVLGPVIKTVTQIQAGYQHNVIPDECKFVIDVRINECYELEEVFGVFQENCQAKLSARSFNNRPSGISATHPFVKKGLSLGLKTFGSPTLSDQVHFHCPSIKVGPGKSERSHQADEFIYLSEIAHGVETYIQLLDGFEFV